MGAAARHCARRYARSAPRSSAGLPTIFGPRWALGVGAGRGIFPQRSSRSPCCLDRAAKPNRKGAGSNPPAIGMARAVTNRFGTARRGMHPFTTLLCDPAALVASLNWAFRAACCCTLVGANCPRRRNPHDHLHPQSAATCSSPAAPSWRLGPPGCCCPPARKASHRPSRCRAGRTITGRAQRPWTGSARAAFWMSGTVRRAGDGGPRWPGSASRSGRTTVEGQEHEPQSHGATLTDKDGAFRLEMPQIIPIFGQPHGHLAYDSGEFKNRLPASP